jgi:hypothetical protein
MRRRGLGGAAGADLVDAGLDRRLQRPDVARVADEVEAVLVERDAGRDVRHQPSGGLAVPVAGLEHAGDGVLELRVLELARDAERAGEVEVPHPQAVDAVDGGDRVGVLHALRRLDLGEERGAVVGGGELVEDGAAGIEVMGDAQRHAARALGVYFMQSRMARASSALATIGTIRPSAPMSMARAMW